MTETPTGDGRKRLLAQILLNLTTHARGLWATYLLLARDTVREEAKAAGRRTTITAALLLIFGVGALFLAIGLSRLLTELIGEEGIGFIIVGGFMAIVATIFLAIVLRSGKKE